MGFRQPPSLCRSPFLCLLIHGHHLMFFCDSLLFGVLWLRDWRALYSLLCRGKDSFFFSPFHIRVIRVILPTGFCQGQIGVALIPNPS
jgi:hypothetical protein